MITILVGIIMGLLTSYTDIKEMALYDKHIFPFALFGILYYAVVEHSAIGLIGLIQGMFVGLVAWLLRAWGDGDVVLLATYSSLLPYSHSPHAAPYPNALTIFLNSVVFATAYGLPVWMKHKKRYVPHAPALLLGFLTSALYGDILYTLGR